MPDTAGSRWLIPPSGAAVRSRPGGAGRVRRRQHGFAIFLQPGGVDSVHPLWPASPKLAFSLPQWNLEFVFRPLDFIQVNAGLNGKMIAVALDAARSAAGRARARPVLRPGQFHPAAGAPRARGGGRGRRGGPGAARARERRAQRHRQRRVPCRRPGQGSQRRHAGCARASTSCCSTRRAPAPTSCWRSCR